MGKNKRRPNKQLDVKSAGAQREEVKVPRKSAKVGAAVVRQCAVTRERRPESELLRFVLDIQGHVTPDIKRRLPGRGVWVSANRGVLAEAVRRRTLARALKAESDPRKRAETDPGAETGVRREVGNLPETGEDHPVEDLSAEAHRDLPAEVEELLRRSALGALGLANKAGQLTLGFEAIARALASGGVVGLIHAAEAAEDGRRKLDWMFASGAGEGGRKPAPALPGGAADEDNGAGGMVPTESAADDEENDRPVVELFSCAELGSALGRTNVMHAALKKGGASASFLKEARRLSRYLEPAPAKPPKRRPKQDKV
jgi:predicted RNA-binding protein YlxR (DUF448 family)